METFTPNDLISALQAFLRAHRNDAYRVFHYFQTLDRPFLLRSDILDGFALLCDQPEGDVLRDTALEKILCMSQEAAINGNWIYLALRRRIGRWFYVRIHVDTVAAEETSVSSYLSFKESLVDGTNDDPVLELDLKPFNRRFTAPSEDRFIGRGVEFLNRRLSSRMFEEQSLGQERLLQFLRMHAYNEQQLMVSESVSSVGALRRALRKATEIVDAHEPDTSWETLAPQLQTLGFEPGWGDRAERVTQTMRLLLDILDAPSPGALEAFLGSVPMIFSLAIVSPHGWFGQANVLGRPDTGGQVVYILDQVRALEREMRQRLVAQGLAICPQIIVVTRLIPDADGTTSHRRLEPIAGTDNARILRVPFRNERGTVVPHWISRFEIWPYLERYAREAENDLMLELGGRPDLIIGNYSDGNLVASLIAGRLGVTQCAIAHALEKSKYVYSDLFWKANEEHYHFSCQFTADLIAMNTADFIIASTYQEIAGTDDSIGQYEGYMSYTMPGLYRVVHGIDVYDPKFNIMSPGADGQVYFPPTDDARRFHHLVPEIEALVFSKEDTPSARGAFQDPDKPIVFSMARMDRIKNLTGLVDWFGRSSELRQTANLLVASGYVDPQRSDDVEEQSQIRLMHELMDRHGLDGQMRWIDGQVDRKRNGELYRYIADKRGVFVQPALFEAFGLTVIEAMSSGLPTFATCFGGPLEIIKDGVSGFHINPNHGKLAAQKIVNFFEKCQQQPEYWDRISRESLDRVEARYTWELYASRMMTLSRVYGFWKFVSDLERTETRRYLEMFYNLQFRPLVQKLPTYP